MVRGEGLSLVLLRFWLFPGRIKLECDADYCCQAEPFGEWMNPKSITAGYSHPGWTSCLVSANAAINMFLPLENRSCSQPNRMPTMQSPKRMIGSAHYRFGIVEERHHCPGLTLRWHDCGDLSTAGSYTLVTAITPVFRRM